MAGFWADSIALAHDAIGAAAPAISGDHYVNVEIITAVLTVAVILGGIWWGGSKFTRFMDEKVSGVRDDMRDDIQELRDEIKDTFGRIFKRLDAHEGAMSSIREAHVILKTKHDMAIRGGLHCPRCAAMFSRTDDPPLTDDEKGGD